MPTGNLYGRLRAGWLALSRRRVGPGLVQVLAGGLDAGVWVGILVPVGLAAVGVVLYVAGIIRPLAVTATRMTLPHAGGGGQVTRVRVRVASRTRNDQTISNLGLIEYPGRWSAFSKRRWWKQARGTPFTSLQVPPEGITLGSHDAKPLVARWDGAYPPFPTTRVLVHGARKRPVIKKIRETRLGDDSDDA